MKTFQKILLPISIILCLRNEVSAQQPHIQHFRPNTKEGLHVFETTKADTSGFDGMKVRIGGNFTQDFQSLQHQNKATAVMVNSVNVNQLIGINSGFNLAMANLNIDAQLEDGIWLNLTMYLSTRHHHETWVKGGFVQMDKLTFLKSDVIDQLMKNITIKAGAYEVDYGDQHFRRSDGGNSIHNPFVENYIMDEFATEIGAEVYFHPRNGFILMGGVTNGQLNPSVVTQTKVDSLTGKQNYNAPAFHGKIGYDKQITRDFRFRLTGSAYAVKSSASNTLFNGDRTGSHYFLVMENAGANAEANAFSGRFNPRFSQQVLTFMINPFIKFKGLEFFGTYEMANGRSNVEKNMRSATQMAADLIFRFPAEKENFWIGARYNTVTAEMPGVSQKVTIDRMVGSMGWFVTKNIAVKAEYVTQSYKQFVVTDIRSGGMFSGFMLQGTIGF